MGWRLSRSGVARIAAAALEDAGPLANVRAEEKPARVDDYARIFEARGGLYNAAHHLAPRARERERELLIERLAPERGDRVVDVPAGGGYLADGLRHLGRSIRVVCVEPTAHLARDIDTRHVRLRASLDRIALRDGSVDGIGSLAGTHHLDDRPAFFRECRRLLRPDGRIAVADVGDRSSVAAFLDGPVHRYSETGHRGRFFVPGEATELLAAAGFRDVREELVHLAWEFADLSSMVRFCRTLFGLVRADERVVERALRDHFAIEESRSGARLPWCLIYAYGIAG